MSTGTFISLSLEGGEEAKDAGATPLLHAGPPSPAHRRGSGIQPLTCLLRCVPILQWPKHFNRQQLFGDVIAGIVVFVFFIPSGMAYALLAEMPPVYGLYSCCVPLLLYAAFGTSREMFVGPQAIPELLAGVAAGSLHAQGTSEYIATVLQLTLLAGIIQVAFGVTGLGKVVNFLSNAVMKGYTAGCAIVIFLSQMKNVSRIPVASGSTTYETVAYTLSHLQDCSAFTIIISLSSWMIMLSVKYWKHNFPPTELQQANCYYGIARSLSNVVSLIVVVVGACMAYLIRLAGHEVDIVGYVPAGVKAPVMVSLNSSDVVTLLPSALIISLVSFMSNWAVVKKFSASNITQPAASQELFANGIANLVGAFFNSFPVGAGLSRSAVAAQSGVQTRFAMIVSGALMYLALLVLSPIFFFIPLAALGAVVQVSVLAFIDLAAIKQAWDISRSDFAVLAATFCATLVSIEWGVFVGAFCSLIALMKPVAFPYTSFLGFVHETGHYVDLKLHPNAEPIASIAIVQMHASLVFANCEHFRGIIETIVNGDQSTAVETLIIDCSGWNDVDLNGVLLLKELCSELKTRSIAVIMVGLNLPVQTKFEKAGLMNLVGEDKVFVNVSEAVDAVNLE